MFLGSETDFSSLTDEDIFFKSKDKPALFAVILERYQKAFLRKAKSVLRNDEDAEDVVQTAFTKMYLKSHLFTPQGDGSFKSWAYRVLMNTAFSYYQKNKTLKSIWLSEEMEEILPDLDVKSLAENREIADYIYSVLSRVPEHFSAILSKFFLEGKSHKEIAEEDRISVSLAKVRLHRAKEAFRKAALNVGLDF